jgi:hypothetical protein
MERSYFHLTAKLNECRKANDDVGHKVEVIENIIGNSLLMDALFLKN